MIRSVVTLIKSRNDMLTVAMKTNRIVLFLAVTSVFASCVTDEPVVEPAGESAENMNEIVAKAQSTKVLTQDGINILWENKDAILLRFQADDSTVPVSCTYTTTMASPGATAVFKRNEDTEIFPNRIEGKYIATYPASVHYISWAKKNNVLFALNPDQIARDKGFDASSAIMIAASEDAEFTFRHVVSYIKFTVTPKSSPFNKVTVTSGDESQFMISRIRVNFDEEFSYALESMNATGNVNQQTRNHVSLSTSDNGNFAPGTYYIAINPDTYAKGLKFTFENEDADIAVIAYEGALEALPGQVLDVGAVGVLDYQMIRYPNTDAGTVLKGSLCPKISDVTWDTTYRVTSGLDYYQMKVLTDAGEKQDMYLLRTDLSKGLDLKVAISDETTSSIWYRQALSEMAVGMNTVSKPLYGMINADFCDNREPINPRGPVHCNGRIWHSVFDLDPSLTHQGLSYVGITDEGRITIAPSSSYESAKSSLRECTGAGVILLMDSEIQGGLVNSSGRDPRTAIGYTSDNIVWMLAVDGRHGTTGMTYSEMASIFKGLGCEAAVNLDGGGSTEMLVRNPKTGTIDICNWPSDPTDGEGGQERPRLNAWAVVKK